MSDFDRFWLNVRIGDGCWEWPGAKNRLGYGRVKVGTETMFAHRAAWLLVNGSLPPAPLVLRHSCDNPSCVRLGHLLPGTKKDNTQDAIRRGRFRRRAVAI